MTNPTAPNTKASTAMPFAGAGEAASEATLCRGVAGSGIRKRLIGRQTTRLSAAQPRQAPRHPKLSLSSAESGHPMVLAKPVIKVMPVIDARASRP